MHVAFCPLFIRSSIIPDDSQVMGAVADNMLLDLTKFISRPHSLIRADETDLSGSDIINSLSVLAHADNKEAAKIANMDFNKLMNLPK